jgi:hypothetical protein
MATITAIKSFIVQAPGEDVSSLEVKKDKTGSDQPIL